ncbi:asnC family protein [Paraburkholderia xenovorans LB400]|uniref:Transcriptional regulator, AsnC family n=1 Tax=Paraburkholderia xenovorans (strain LB400) TaxID=266265 RepID=Q13JB4_PARXL|nr:Lrp/AsnC family transcriptional regulator [Paraburkholderia xenovorans]ABE35825.1 transcriptional regulator, AsnC family [Paraburkholderia xenovorans LB400]AIP35716.1 asnC family protein [Paraburkholderia xenovorans LB400]
MDSFDWKMLAALQADARLTNQEVGNMIGLSASQCSRRRTALEEAGVIAGYSARLDSKAVGLDVLAFVHVNLQAHDAKSLRAFQRLVESDDAIQEAHAVSGDADYMLKVVAENLEQLADFVTNTLLVSDTISHVKSYVVLKQMKQTSQLPTKR